VAEITAAFQLRGWRATCVDIEYFKGNMGGYSHAMDICTPAGFALGPKCQSE
jgi:hypothetical protein